MSLIQAGQDTGSVMLMAPQTPSTYYVHAFTNETSNQPIDLGVKLTVRPRPVVSDIDVTPTPASFQEGIVFCGQSIAFTENVSILFHSTSPNVSHNKQKEQEFRE